MEGHAWRTDKLPTQTALLSVQVANLCAALVADETAWLIAPITLGSDRVQRNFNLAAVHASTSSQANSQQCHPGTGSLRLSCSVEDYWFFVTVF